MMEILSKRNIFAVVGASRDKKKYGFKVFKALKENGYIVFPINPNADEILGVSAYPDLKSLPKKPDVVITVVPPKITEKIVEECAELGIKTIWMQPGSESENAIEMCEKNGIKCIHHACIVVDGLKKEI